MKINMLMLLCALSNALGSLLLASGPPEAKVTCANLVYDQNKTSKCFSNGFLEELEKKTNIETEGNFLPVRLDSSELFQHPFAIMSGEGAFSLSAKEREHLHSYLLNGGFLLASAGCSSKAWQNSFTTQIERMFPERKLVKLEMDHPIFHTVSDVGMSKYKSGKTRFPDLYGLEIDGRIVLVYSPDGLNDTASVKTGGCCCCGGNEIKAAKLINMNLLAFALTH